jgi:tRNA 2-selenouridine synthase
MPKTIDIIDFLNLKKIFPVIDVRSPGEYLKGHIASSINLPILNNKERAEIGTVYLKKGKDKAYLLALELIGPQLKTKAGDITSVTKQKQLLMYCWRGGMRSESMSWLYEYLGYEPYVLKGGYKSYR